MSSQKQDHGRKEKRYILYYNLKYIFVPLFQQKTPTSHFHFALGPQV